MKNFYLIISFIFLSWMSNAQTYLSEDFSSGQMPPSGWTIQTYPNQWSCAPTNKAGGTAPEGKFTYIQGNNTTRFISPVVDLTGLTTVTLMFNHMYDWYGNPAPKLGVATRTGSGAWNSVWEVTPTSNIAAQTKVLSITNSDIGANFQFCFYLTGNFFNMDYWYVDNIDLMTPANLDAALSSINLPPYIEINQPTTLTGKVKNMGNTNITSFDVIYSIEGGTEVSDSYTGQNLALGQSYSFTHGTPINIANSGSYKVDVKIQNVNGGSDENPGNDTLSAYIGVVPYSPARKVFCEEATGTWCGWCVRGICYMDYMSETYPDTWIGVAVHNGDPMVVTAWDNAISSIIPNFTGYPSGTINRVKDWDPDQFEEGYLEEIDAITPATVEVVNFSWDPVTREVSFDVKSEFLIDIMNELRFAAVISEDSLWGTTSTWGQTNYYYGGSNGPMCGFESLPQHIPAADMHYDHVGRAIFDGPFGTEGSIVPPITGGTSQSYHYSYIIPDSWVYENLHFIGLVIDHKTGHILNATDELIWVGTSELNNDLRLRVYPNPATDHTTVQFVLDKPGTTGIKVYDLPGNCVLSMSPELYPAGMNKTELNLNNLRQGFYFVEVTVNGHSNIHKIAVTR